MKHLIYVFMLLSFLFGSCAKKQPKKVTVKKSDIEITDGLMTPEILWSFGRIGNVVVSSDKSKIVYDVRYYNVAENKSNSEIFIMNTDGSGKRQLTNSNYSETSPVFINNDTHIAFLSNEGGSSQLWTMDINGEKRKKISNYEKDIESFLFSPDEKYVIYVSQVKNQDIEVRMYHDLDKSTGFVVNDLMYRHWDRWKETIPHPFLARYDGRKLKLITDILEGEPYESPMLPFGGIEQLAWSPASNAIAYTCRKKTGLEYSISTNSDIYVYNVDDKITRNLTEGMMGYDTNPLFSPDGEYIAWQSMEREGYEADLNRLFVMNLNTGEKTFVSEKFESDVNTFCWADNGVSLFFTGTWHGTTQLYEVDLQKNLHKITEGKHDFKSVAVSDKGLIAKKQSMSEPDEICSVNVESGEISELSFENKNITSQLNMGNVEERWVKTTDGKDMLVWVIYPPGFDPAKKYPALLYCQGGPQSSLSQFWSYRWNFQLMAANGYIVVAPNRRGMPGFGRAWNEEISGDYGGQCMDDYFSAIDDVKRESFVDADRLGCVGASFGGYSAYWMAGNHNKRFKAFIAHDGIFNMEMQYLETEELWFANWEFGGPYWDKTNKTAQKTYAASPHLFVDKWDTPILCIHGEKDYRILANQTTAAFNAARIRGIPAQLMIFPDENHWVTKPQNSILWQRTFYSWLDKWLK